MISEKEQRFWEGLSELVAAITSRPTAHVTVSFLLYFAASCGVRCTGAELAERGLAAWSLSEYFRGVLLQIMPCTPGDLLRDVVNGFFGVLFLTVSPALAFWAYRFGYPIVLWAGLAWPVHLWGLQLAPWPNVDLLLWPALAVAAQAFAVRRVLFALEQSGFEGLAYRIRNGHLVAPFVGVVLVVGTHLLVISGYFASAWSQIALHWLFAR